MNEGERAELPEEEQGKIPVKGVILLNLNLFINTYNYPIKINIFTLFIDKETRDIEV